MYSRTLPIVLLGGIISLVQSVPSVQLSGGTVLGTTCKHSPAQLFQGIPYAQPPTGKLRFMAPRPLNDSYSNGVFNATKPPSACIQWDSSTDVESSTSEDCLYLDIYTPPNATAASSLPVKVWAYGGSNLAGAVTYPLYDSCFLATDAIVAAFNYRLGPLGFLGLDSAGIKGNMAIQDYLAALGWVQSNIANFGGDPSKVLLFGQSSGADDSFVVSTLPQAKSLISAVVLESGGGEDVTPYRTAQFAGASYAQTLNCSTSDLDCLQSSSVEELIDAFLNTPALAPDAGNGQAVSVILGVNVPNVTVLNLAFLDGDIVPHEPLKVGSQVPLIAGSNEFDASLLVLPIYALDSQPLTVDNYTSFLSEWGSASSAIGQQYPLSLFNSSGSTAQAVIEAIIHITTTASFTCSTYKALRAALAAGTPAYAYRFNHTPSCPWFWVDGEQLPGQYADSFLSTHTAELPFVFANLENQPWGNGTCNATANEVELSQTLTGAWTALAAQGNPSTSRQSWPPFNNCQTQGLLIQDSAQVATLDFSECEFWDQIWASYGGVAFSNVTAGSSCGAVTNGTGTTPLGTSSGSRPYSVEWLSFILIGGLLALL